MKLTGRAPIPRIKDHPVAQHPAHGRLGLVRPQSHLVVVGLAALESRADGQLRDAERGPSLEDFGVRCHFGLDEVDAGIDVFSDALFEDDGLHYAKVGKEGC